MGCQKKHHIISLGAIARASGRRFRLGAYRSVSQDGEKRPKEELKVESRLALGIRNGKNWFCDVVADSVIARRPGGDENLPSTILRSGGLPPFRVLKPFALG